MQYRTSRQEVTGLAVNRKVNVRHEYRHNVRAMVHSLFKKGTFELYGAVEKGGVVTIEKRPGTLNELHGRLGFIDGIDLLNKKHAQEQNEPAHMSSKELMYKGDTDNVYLTHAIRSLAAQFPDLAEIKPDGKIRLKVRLYKYTRSSTARILGLNDGGSSILARFISSYKKETDKFTAPGLKSPVLILYDNDSGAVPIRNAVKNASHVTVHGTEPFVHVVANLYTVPTPLLNGANLSKIEDFFDAALKMTQVRGKTFNDANGHNTATHYGKSILPTRSSGRGRTPSTSQAFRSS